MIRSLYIFVALALAAFTVPAQAQNVSNYRTQGGATSVIGGTLQVTSGGTLQVDSGATFTNGGIAVPVLRVATDAIASGQTAKTVTVTGATASSKCVASANEVPTNAVYIKSVVAGTNQAVVTSSADPGASNLDITVICAN